INTGFINGLPKKWLAFCQSLRNTNHVKESELASLFGKLKYEENLIDSIYGTNKVKTLVFATPLSTAFCSTSIVQNFQDSPNDEEDARSNQEYMNDLEEEYQAIALLDKSKRFFKKGTQSFSGAKTTDQTKCHKCDMKDFEAKYNKVKAKLALLSSSALASNSSLGKNKGLIVEKYEWDEEEVSSDENEGIEVKDLMALADEERVSVGKESTRNGEWVKISIQKILKENQNLRNELKELTSITETWLNSSNKANQCISEQIPTQKKKILGIDQLTKDSSSSGPKDLVFVKSSAYILNMSITSDESQRNTTDPSVAVTNSSTSDYDSANESLVCSTPLPPLDKLAGAKPVFGPKNIKSIFEAKTLKGVIINEPSLAPAKGNISTSVSNTNSSPADKSASHWQGESSSRSIPSRPVIPFPSCIHCGYNDHQFDDCTYHPICELCGSYDHDTHGHNRIISLRRGIKPKNPQHITKNCETYGCNVHTITDHNDIKWFRKREALQVKKVETFKKSKNETSSALRSNTPTKSEERKKMHFKCLSVAKKSTSGAWSAKKQQSVAMSSAEADITHVYIHGFAFEAVYGLSPLLDAMMLVQFRN
ncbi:hypothetical protein Tco_1148231, partial [Tanacetum coccineum]